MSYGLGIFRINTNLDLKISDPLLQEMEIYNIFKTPAGNYVGISKKGQIPSHYELAIQSTPEFIADQKAVVKEGPDEIKERFFRLHLMTTA